MLFNQAISFCISDFLIYCVICLLAAAPVNILPGILALAGQFVLSFGTILA